MEATATLISRLDAEFTEIEKVLDVIEQRMAFVVDRDELGDAVCAAAEIGNRVAAITAKLGRLAIANNVVLEAGQRTIGQYVAARTNHPTADINRSAKAAKWLGDFPILEAAFGHELTLSHVEYLRKNLDATYTSHCQLRTDQQFFVDTAAACSFAGFTQACDYWLVHIDPDGKEPTEQIEKSRFRIGTGRGGRGELNGLCDAVTAQAIRTAVDHEAEKLRRADKETGVERTDGQRKMAALARLVSRGFARSDGTHPAPLGNIVMSLGVAEWALATLSGENADRAGGEPDRVPVHPTGVDGRCELIDGTPIHPFLAVRALGLIDGDGLVHRSQLRRYVLSARGRALDVSVNARQFPEWMRTTALVQSRGRCDTIGCDAPHSWLEIDHVDPVVAGGETCLDNAQPQCRPDNMFKGATRGQIPWRDRPPPPRRRPVRKRSRPPDDDPDDHTIF